VHLNNRFSENNIPLDVKYEESRFNITNTGN